MAKKKQGGGGGGGRNAVVKHVPTRQQRHGFTPFKPRTRPPAGRYDPALDAAERAGNRGLADLLADSGTGRTRAATDYGLGLANIDQEYGRATQDLDTGLARTREDYNTNVATLDRNYQQLASAQSQNAALSGTDQGGTVLAAAMARAQNRAVEQAPLETMLSRYTADDATNRTRLLENVNAQKGALGTEYERQGQDWTTQAARAQRENTQFGLDTSEQRFYQAKLAGYKAPHKPKNEKTKKGVTYRVSGQGPGRVYTLPTGKQFKRDEWVNKWKRRGAQGFLPRPGHLYG